MVVQPFMCMLVRPAPWPSNGHCWHHECRLDIDAGPILVQASSVASAVPMSLAIICLSYDDGSSEIGPISSLAADEVQSLKS